MCDLETSRMGAPYIYDISHLRVKGLKYTIRTKVQCLGVSVTSVRCSVSLRFAACQDESSASRSQEAVQSDPIVRRRTPLCCCLKASVPTVGTKDLSLT